MTFQAEDEIAAVTSAIGAAYGGALAITTTSGPGHGAQDGGDRPRHRDRAAARHLRHPARRAVHGPAHQDRAGRPAAGALRPQLGSAGAGAGRVDARRLLLDRPRGEPHRDQVHGPRDRPLRRLPRERRRAVEDPDRRPSCRRSRCSSGPIPRASSPTRATRRRCRGPGPSRARPASSTASAASRSRTSRGNVNYEPLNHERMVRLRAAKVGGHRPGRPGRRARRRSRGRPAARGLGLDLRLDHGGAARPARARGAGSATSTCAT